MRAFQRGMAQRSIYPCISLVPFWTWEYAHRIPQAYRCHMLSPRYVFRLHDWSLDVEQARGVPVRRFAPQVGLALVGKAHRYLTKREGFFCWPGSVANALPPIYTHIYTDNITYTDIHTYNNHTKTKHTIQYKYQYQYNTTQHNTIHTQSYIYNYFHFYSHTAYMHTYIYVWLWDYA